MAADGVGAILRLVSVGAVMTRARPSLTCPTRGIAVAGPRRLCTPPTPRHRGDAEKRAASRHWWRLSGTSIGHGLLPTSYLSLVLPSYLRVGLLPTSYLSLLPEGYPLIRLLPGTLTQRGLFLEACALLLPTSYLGTWPLTTLLPGTWPLTDLLPGPLT